MKTTTRTYYPNDGTASRTFECRITDVMGGGSLLEVSVSEVRPVRKWWQTRTAYIGCKCFWIDDYETIMEGIDSILSHFILEEEEDAKRRKKFEDFEKMA